MKNTRSRSSIAALCGAVLVVMAFPAVTFGQILEEVTVTAQKREQNLSDVGISITAFTGDQLRQLGMTNTTDLGMHTPGMLVTTYGSGTTTAFNIRGSSQLDFADHQEAPVAVYIDGTYNSYLGGVGFNFFDLDRVEVLRGPQGTLFGRNATGGLVHLISAKPTFENEGYVELTAGEYGQVRAEAVLSGPLSETLAGRLSLAYEKTDGYQENTEGDDVNDMNNLSARLQLLFEPNEDVSVLLSGRYSSDDTNGQGYNIESGLTDIGGIPGLPGTGLVYKGTVEQQNAFCANFFGPPFPLVPGATDCFGYTEPDSDVHSVSLDQLGYFERDHVSLSATIEWQLRDNLQLVSITDWQDFEKNYLEDTDSTPAPLFEFPQTVDGSQFSQEFRLQWDTDTAKWVAGLYYLDIDSDYRSGTDTFNCCLLALDNSWELDTESYAVFFQSEFELSERFSLVGGLRWTEDAKDINAIPTCLNAGSGADFGLPADPCDLFFAGTSQIGPPLIADRSEGEWSGVLELDYRPNEDWLVYLKASRGNKAGGYNAGAAMIYDSAEAFEYAGEQLDSFEAGFKGSLLDGRARLNASIYYYDYNDFQSFSQQGVNLIVFNTDAENVGGEVELTLNPVQGLEILLGASLQDAQQLDVAYGPVVKDRPMPNSPDLTFNGLARYEWPALQGFMSAQIDMSYVDDRALNGIDHPGLIGDSYTLVNARIGYVTADQNWDLSLWVKNLGDEDYISTAFDITTFTGVIIEAPGQPRWMGATVKYSF